jgi:hypothetical protein
MQILLGIVIGYVLTEYIIPHIKDDWVDYPY